MPRPALVLATGGVALALPVWFLGPSPAAVHRASETEVQSHVVRQLVGSWGLVSYAQRGADGGLSYPFGRDAVGKLTYTRDGNQWATIGRPGAAKNLPDAFFYTGTFDVRPNGRTIVHHVRYSSVLAWEGTDLVRSFRLRANRLTLTIAPTSPGQPTGTLRWRRLRSG